MISKKEPGKFTIKFNVMDPAHRQVVDLLESMGRSKAQFISNAVLHYIHCSQTPDIPQPAPTDHAAIEAIVRRILSEKEEKTEVFAESSEKPQKKKLRKSEDIDFNEAVSILGEDNIAAISNTIAAFRKK